MANNWTSFIWITFVLGLICPSWGATLQASTELYNHLFENGEKPYIPALVPKCKAGQYVNVSIDVALRQLISLEEKAQVLTSNVWVRTGWEDCRLGWNTTEYDVDHLTVPYSTAWVPDLALYDSAAEEEMMPGRENFLMKISSTGYVTYFFPTVLKSICLVKVTYFPFDVQKCTLKFGSWTHSLADLNMLNRNPEGDLSSFVTNNEWDVVQFHARRNVANFTSGVYTDVQFTMTMKRRPQFYLMTMLFPCILVSAIAMIGFLLPAESGEKISLEVTVLLSLAVFLLVISDFLPPSADQFPIIGTYFAAAMIMVSFSLVLSVLVLNVHHRGENGIEVPRWARKLFLEKLGGVCSRKSKYEASLEKYNNWESSSSRSSGSYKKYDVTNNVSNQTNNHNSQPASGVERLISEQLDALHKVTNHLSDKDRLEEMCDEWQALARILDRIFLFIYLLLSVIISIVLLIPLVSDSEDQVNEI